MLRDKPSKNSGREEKISLEDGKKADTVQKKYEEGSWTQEERFKERLSHWIATTSNRRLKVSLGLLEQSTWCYPKLTGLKNDFLFHGRPIYSRGPVKNVPFKTHVKSGWAWIFWPSHSQIWTCRSPSGAFTASPLNWATRMTGELMNYDLELELTPNFFIGYTRYVPDTYL